MPIIQQNSGTFNGSSFTASFPAASSPSNLVVLIVAANTVVTTPSGFTLRTSQVNFMGHYLWDRAGGATSYTVSTSTGQGVWYLAEIAGGVYDTSNSQNNTASSTTYNTPTITPASGTKVLLASIGQTGSTANTTVSGWTNSFVEQYDIQVSAGDWPMSGFAALVDVPGSTAYSTTATYSHSSVGRSAIIGAYTTSSGGSVSTATGTTGVSVGLSGAASALAVAAGSLALGLALSGTAVPVAVATGTLPVVAGLTGTASQATSATVTGTLPAALSLTGTASVVATTTGALPLSAGLTGTGSVVGSYVTTGNLPLTVALTGTAQTITTVTGALAVAVGLTGSANVPAVPALTGTLPTALSLSGAANIVALTTGTLPLSVGLSGVGVNPSTEHDITVTAALDPRPWASALTTRTNTGTLVQRSWEARLE